MPRPSIVLVPIAALVLAYAIAAPWITVHQIKTAAQTRDGQALAEHVDFASVRQSLKDQINAVVLHKMGGGDGQALNPLAVLVAPLAGALVDKTVDAYVTPAGVAQLLAGREPAAAPATPSPAPGSARAPVPANNGAAQPLADASMGYRSINRFVVTTHGKAGETQFVLARQGLSWKLAEIILPPQ